MFEEIKTKKAPKAVGPYSQGIKCGNMVFISGQLGIDPAIGELCSEDIEVQTGKTIENIRSILNEVDLSLHNVVRCDIFLKDMNDFSKVNKIYAGKFNKDPKPVRQTVQVSELPLDAKIEISCIAIKDNNG
jgi:2-iminobutanoate/2-iminopropanoate deaminase